MRGRGLQKGSERAPPVRRRGGVRGCPGGTRLEQLRGGLADGGLAQPDGAPRRWEHEVNRLVLLQHPA